MNRDPTYVRRAEKLVDGCSRMHPGVPWLSQSEFSQRSQEDQWTIVDVRSPLERSVSVIPGALSKQEFEAHIEEQAKRQIMVYCTVGCRSGAYTKELCKAGLDAFNLRGGVLAWALDGGPFVTIDGKPTRRVHVHGQRWNVLPPGYEAVR